MQRTHEADPEATVKSNDDNTSLLELHGLQRGQARSRIYLKPAQVEEHVEGFYTAGAGLAWQMIAPRYIVR